MLTLINFAYSAGSSWIFTWCNIVRNAHSYYYFFYLFAAGKTSRARVKEKIDKCVKEKLMDFCDLLNIPVKGTTKKVNIGRNVFILLETFFILLEKLMRDP